MKLNNLTGNTYGRLTVRKRVYIKRKYKITFWQCICSCGKIKNVGAAQLKNGKTLSCGCLGRENRIKSNIKHGYCAGGNKHPLYSTWRSMRQRCNNLNNPSYPYYGGIGIKVCKRWQKFSNFIIDMGKRPNNTSLDRINPFGNYTLSNCRWANNKTQINNRKSILPLIKQIIKLKKINKSLKLELSRLK